MAEEFSHTVIHRKPLGVFGQQRMPPKQPAKPAPGQYFNVALLNHVMLLKLCLHVIVDMWSTNYNIYVLFVSMCTNHVC